MRKVTLLAALFAFALGSTTSCAGGDDSQTSATSEASTETLAPWTPDERPTDLPHLTDEEALALRQESLDGIAEAADIVDPPDAEIIRWISIEESTEVMAKCLQDAGWPVVIDQGGWAIADLPESQQLAYDTDSYICQSQYPVDPRNFMDLSDSQKGVMYDYSTEWLIPCLDLHGHAASEPPTREAFIAASADDYPIWYAFDSVGPRSMEDAMTACPPSPGIEHLWS